MNSKGIIDIRQEKRKLMISALIDVGRLDRERDG